MTSRIDKVMQWIALELTTAQIYEAADQEGWGVSTRQIDKYIRRATDCFAAIAEPDRQALVGRTLRQLNTGYRRCISNGDERGALAYIQERSKLVGLNAAQKNEITGKDGGPIEIDDATDRLIAKLIELGAAGDGGPGGQGSTQPA